ncbi:MAG: asparagine synthase, partial [Prosthecobacter sp.]|nr:asparagine synthase [Prosthecobacter sp.]
MNCGDPVLLEQMSSRMRHRGPDGSGLQWFPELGGGLAHNRLAILDLTDQGAQPMASKDGRHWIVFNGEIYNHRALRAELESRGHEFHSTSDTEVLLAGLIEWGEDCLNRLNGMFAFAWMDRSSGRLFGARDHLGIKPLYYTQMGGGFIFASEIKALLACPFIKAERDEEALRTPARFQISPSTGFKGILKLPPAHCFTWHEGHLEVRQYWSIEPTETVSNEAEAEEEISHLIDLAVRRQMVADVPVGTFLSGGLDSSLISALMRRESSGPIHAFTIKFSAQDQKFEQASEDVVYARRVARQFDLKLHEFEVEPKITDLLPKMVWHLDEPLSDPAAINTCLISQAARDVGIVVLLNGVGGDEIFGGYRKHLACARAGQYQSLVPAWARSAIQGAAGMLPVATSRRGLLPARVLKRFLSYASLPETERYLASDLSLNPEAYAELYAGADYHQSLFWRQQRATLETPGLSYLTRMCLNDTRVFLPEHNLTYSDKASMAAGVETRPALVDKDVVTAMFLVIPQLRFQRGVQKHLLIRIGLRHLPH